MIWIFARSETKGIEQIIDDLYRSKIPYFVISKIDIFESRITFSNAEENICIQNPYYLKEEIIKRHVKLIYFASDIPINKHYLQIGEDDELREYVYADRRVIVDFLEYVLLTVDNCIGTYNADQRFGNKLTNNLLAKEAGFLLPNGLVCSSRIDLEQFLGNGNKNVLKCMSYPIKDTFIDKGTVSFSKESLGNLPQIFSPSYFQELVNYKYELRVFVFKTTIYAARLSSIRSTSEVDIRKGYINGNVKLVPTDLPKKWTRLLAKLKKITGLDMFSIDLLVSPEDELYFLDLNPNGQFGWLSYKCNYNIYGKISKEIQERYRYSKGILLQ